MKYYGSGYGVGSTKYCRKIISFLNDIDNQKTVGFSVGISDSIICGLNDYGITFYFFGFCISIGWFIAECGTWKDTEVR